MKPTDENEAQLSDEELALHLAGGTLAAWQALGEETERPGGWFGASSDAEERACLARGPRAGRSGLPPAVRARLSELRAAGGPAVERERLAALGARLIGWRSPDYPAALLNLPQPPLALAVLGRWPPPEDVLAVVGARAATTYGVRVAERVGRSAATRGLALVSGLARGIDRAALEGCQRGAGWALAVLGCGLDIAYPRQNRALQQSIGERGSLVSEFPLGQRPDRWTFPRRNRVIAALARAVLVVEAGRRSGALITVEHAVELGRDVLAVPGPIDAPQSVGCNRLLADGATPLLDPAEIGALLGLQAQGLCAAAPETDPLLAALGGGSTDVDDLARRLAWPVARARSRLIALELTGQVRRTAAGHWEQCC